MKLTFIIRFRLNYTLINKLLINIFGEKIDFKLIYFRLKLLTKIIFYLEASILEHLQNEVLIHNVLVQDFYQTDFLIFNPLKKSLFLYIITI